MNSKGMKFNMSKIEEDKKDNGTISKTEKKVAPKKKNKTAIKPDESVKKVKTQNDIKVKKEIAEEKIENEETAEKIEEKDEFDVELTEVGGAKVKVIKVVREITGLGLKEAKEVVDGAPKVIKEGASKAEAEEIKTKLEAEGAKVTLK